jgi:hypothetical protein
MRRSGPGAIVWRRCVKLAGFNAKSQRRKGSSGQESIEWPGEIVRRAAGCLSGEPSCAGLDCPKSFLEYPITAKLSAVLG